MAHKLQINCGNFTMACAVGYRAVLDQRQDEVITLCDISELRMPFIRAGAHVTRCLACEKARERG